jgi:hypothetical protein
MRYPVFITGSSSSGSHLLTTMLDVHHKVVVGPELQFFYHPFIYAEWSVARQRVLEAFHLCHSRHWKAARRLFPRLKAPRVSRANNVLRSIDVYGYRKSEVRAMLEQASGLDELVDRFMAGFGRFREKPDAVW